MAAQVPYLLQSTGFAAVQVVRSVGGEADVCYRGDGDLWTGIRERENRTYYDKGGKEERKKKKSYFSAAYEYCPD